MVYFVSILMDPVLFKQEIWTARGENRKQEHETIVAQRRSQSWFNTMPETPQDKCFERIGVTDNILLRSESNLSQLNTRALRLCWMGCVFTVMLSLVVQDRWHSQSLLPHFYEGLAHSSSAINWDEQVTDISNTCILGELLAIQDIRDWVGGGITQLRWHHVGCYRHSKDLFLDKTSLI